MVAYREVYEDLREAVRDENSQYHGTAKMALKEFEFVFDYALPVVRSFNSRIDRPQIEVYRAIHHSNSTHF